MAQHIESLEYQFVKRNNFRFYNHISSLKTIAYSPPADEEMLKEIEYKFEILRLLKNGKPELASQYAYGSREVVYRKDGPVDLTGEYALYGYKGTQSVLAMFMLRFLVGTSSATRQSHSMLRASTPLGLMQTLASYGTTLLTSAHIGLLRAYLLP